MSENWIKVDEDKIRYVWICPKCRTHHYGWPSSHGGIRYCSNECYNRIRGDKYDILIEYSHAEILENNQCG